MCIYTHSTHVHVLHVHTITYKNAHIYLSLHTTDIHIHYEHITHQKQTHVHMHEYKLRHAKCVHTKHIQSYIYKYTTYIHGN